MSQSFQHNNIERSTSRIWKKRELNKIVKACAEAEYDVVDTGTQIVVGLKDTDQIFLKALKGNGSWLVRYDQGLFDESLVN
jgi:hypothetical protein